MEPMYPSVHLDRGKFELYAYRNERGYKFNFNRRKDICGVPIIQLKSFFFSDEDYAALKDAIKQLEEKEECQQK